MTLKNLLENVGQDVDIFGADYLRSLRSGGGAGPQQQFDGRFVT